MHYQQALAELSLVTTVDYASSDQPTREQKSRKQVSFSTAAHDGSESDSTTDIDQQASTEESTTEDIDDEIEDFFFFT